ncbi:hypothetical protein BIY23_01045 [Wolbachia pipientis]|uniref:Uncharacterized protein n=1 Tax=Wolbachia pipientis TaxID=955 RepID=A0A1E7QLG6_WOLPI|nr:hypothetical protein [Wolbachia pipientis]OEY87059.1 hypothetical protein BIY23_01045 [Wolbachia pipientis]
MVFWTSENLLSINFAKGLILFLIFALILFLFLLLAFRNGSIIWAVAQFKHYNKKFIEIWLVAVRRKLKEFTAQELVRSICAIHKLAVNSQDARIFLSEWEECALEILCTFNQVDLHMAIDALSKSILLLVAKINVLLIKLLKGARLSLLMVKI